MARVRVYRASRVRDMYVYVSARDDLTRVPDALLHRTGVLKEAMELDLEPERLLARADARRVLMEIEENGYYLQLPPPV